jgi:hyperpolarization activated cyclic nucleotide-gated potassium channel 2
MASMDKKAAEFKKKINAFNDFAFKIKLPSRVLNTIQNYYKANFYKNMYNTIDPKHMIKNLPSQLAKQLKLICFEFLKEEITIFRLDPDFTANIV